MSHKSAQILVVTVLFLVALGVTMLCSTSVFGAHASADDVYYDVKRQVTWLGVGSMVCLALALIDYHWWQRSAPVWYGLAVVLLALCFVPHVGQKINGEYRWISAEIFGRDKPCSESCAFEFQVLRGSTRRHALRNRAPLQREPERFNEGERDQ